MPGRRDGRLAGRRAGPGRARRRRSPPHPAHDLGGRLRPGRARAEELCAWPTSPSTGRRPRPQPSSSSTRPTGRGAVGRGAGRRLRRSQASRASSAWPARWTPRTLHPPPLRARRRARRALAGVRAGPATAPRCCTRRPWCTTSARSRSRPVLIKPERLTDDEWRSPGAPGARRRDPRRHAQPEQVAVGARATTSAGTAPATRTASPARRSPRAPASSSSPTPGTS